jgi:hypothetical protein
MEKKIFFLFLVLIAVHSQTNTTANSTTNATANATANVTAVVLENITDLVKLKSIIRKPNGTWTNTDKT